MAPIFPVGAVSPEGDPPLIRISVRKSQSEYLITQPWHHSQEHTDLGEVAEFSFRVHPTYEFRSLILGLGQEARVLEPDSLREGIKKELQEMLGLIYRKILILLA